MTTRTLLPLREAVALYRQVTGRTIAEWQFYKLCRENVFPRGSVVYREGVRIFIAREGLLEFIEAGGSPAPKAPRETAAA